MVRWKFRDIVLKASDLMELWHFHLRNLASDIGVIGKNSDYVRFILLGRSRTGSNLLRGLLNSHRGIIAFGEIFRHYGAIGWDFSHFPQSKKMSSLIENDPVRFLETRVFGNFPKHISAAGFKIFYYHAHNDAWEPVWTYLNSQKDLKVIHVKRKNILKTYLSRRRALETNAWVRKGANDPEDSKPISLSYEECIEEFAKTRTWEQHYDGFFEKHHKIDVLYEDLASDHRGEMRRIQEFLGVDYEVVEPRTTKQSRRPLASSILNYFELKERFAGTSWEEFFED